MGKLPQTLEQRRLGLLERCAEQRRTLAFHAHGVRDVSVKIDSAMNVVRRIRQHPGWIAAVLVGVAVIKPERLATVAKTAVAALRTFNKVAPIVAVLNQRRQRTLG